MRVETDVTLELLLRRRNSRNFSAGFAFVFPATRSTDDFLSLFFSFTHAELLQPTIRSAIGGSNSSFVFTGGRFSSERKFARKPPVSLVGSFRCYIIGH